MPQARHMLSLLLATAMFTSLAVAALAAPPENLSQYAAQGYVPGEVIVKFKSWASPTTKRKIHFELRATPLRTSPLAGFTVVQLNKGADVRKAAATYARRAAVAWAEPNYIRQALFVPNDPLYYRQWDMSNPTYKGINVEGAWDYTRGSSTVKVAVIDTGVAYENYDDDKDGFYEYLKAPDLANTRFAEGYDFVNGDKHANDDYGHGTHVTGTIAQSTNNAYGVAGVAPNVTIIPIKVLSAGGWGTEEWIANGIYYATYAGARIINMSLGGYFPSQAERDACWYAYKRGVTIVAAAGNGGGELGGIGYPAGYDESVIAVGATDYENKKTFYSDYGPSLDLFYYGAIRGNGLDIMAPGGDATVDKNGDGFPDGVLQQTLAASTDPLAPFFVDPLNFTFEYFMGTSMASPHVAGVAALLASVGVTNPDSIRGILESTATDLETAGYDYDTGWGLVNATAAVEAAAASLYDQGPNANAGPDQALTDVDGDGREAAVLDGSGSTWSTGFPIISYQWKDNGVLLAEGVSATLNFSVGSHTIALTCIDSMGKSDTDTALITVGTGLPIIRVMGIDIAAQKSWLRYNLTAAVSIVDGLGRPVYRAAVSGRWSGSLSKTMGPIYTNSQGQATFNAGTLKPGTYTFTVTGVSKSGFSYRSELNSESSDSRTFY